jgi:hypothetical protein
MLLLFLTSALFVSCETQDATSLTTDTETETKTPASDNEDNLDIETNTEIEPTNDNDTASSFDDTQDSAAVSEEDDEAEEEEEEEEETSLNIPFGFWGLNGYHSSDGFLDVQTRFGTTVFQMASSAPNWTVNTFLPLVRDSGMKVTLRMTSNPDYSGSFNINTWKADMDNWVGSGVQEFIDDGTLIGHMLLDDIYNFAGTDATAADLDEMARYSKEILPGLFTFVRERASNAPIPISGTYEHVDAFVNQFTTVNIDNGEVTDYDGNGDIDVYDYAYENAGAAESLGVGIIMGLNICDGGNGESGQVGWRAPTHRTFYAMSANEILAYGTALLEVPDVLMFLMWEYDGQEAWSDGSIGSDYFDQQVLQEAIYSLSQL